MDLSFSAEDECFRAEVRDWLETNLSGEFSVVRGRGGPGDEHALPEERMAWERRLGADGWIGLGWPKEHGGRELGLFQRVIFNEEYARARGPGRIGHIGEHLLGPTLLLFGTEEQKRAFLPGIVRGETIWCQGYSEPNAGSDLAAVSTRARLVDGEWVIDGQKVWTSLAQWSQWCFVLARTDPEAPKHKGLSYLLVPMDQPGIEIRPIRQLTGTSEFSEVFYDGARTAEDNLVGSVNGGWRVAMGTLAFERGESTLGQQLNFRNEFEAIVQAARRAGRDRDPVVRQRMADIATRLEIMRLNALRMLSQEDASGSGPGTVLKLYWATLHRDMGELAIDILGGEATLELDAHAAAQRLFLFSRADTIYAGANEIQRTIIGERALGLPREP